MGRVVACLAIALADPRWSPWPLRWWPTSSVRGLERGTGGGGVQRPSPPVSSPPVDDDHVNGLGGDRVDELWPADDFEVLHWVLERFERNGHRVEVGEALRVFPEEHYDSVRESLRRLSSHTYLVAVNGSGSGRGGRPGAPVVTDDIGRALRGVGEWPDNAELLADRMLAVLVEGAVHESDPEKRFKLKAGLEGVGGMTRDVLVGVVAAAITRSTDTARPWSRPRDTIAPDRP